MEKTVKNVIFLIQAEIDAINYVAHLYPGRKEIDGIKLKLLESLLKDINNLE